MRASLRRRPPPPTAAHSLWKALLRVRDLLAAGRSVLAGALLTVRDILATRRGASSRRQMTTPDASRLRGRTPRRPRLARAILPMGALLAVGGLRTMGRKVAGALLPRRDAPSPAGSGGWMWMSPWLELSGAPLAAGVLRDAGRYRKPGTRRRGRAHLRDRPGPPRPKMLVTLLPPGVVLSARKGRRHRGGSGGPKERIARCSTRSPTNGATSTPQSRQMSATAADARVSCAGAVDDVGCRYCPNITSKSSSGCVRHGCSYRLSEDCRASAGRGATRESCCGPTCAPASPWVSSWSLRRSHTHS
mmetsp:Transcript_14754/g.45044  ORF Transcript_14754/g.45044 Transcript_14754/m.45044 type:complete len:304 (+) Transcript_14754:123-1034(+)